ncbi:MAG: hypothetical protein AB8C84_04275 [Oligoflexales bacterium]
MMSRLQHLLFLLSSLLLTQCGVDTSTDLLLTVNMQGNFVSPAGASGGFEPISHTYELQKIILTQTDGTEVDLYDQDAKEFTIINRPLKIFEYTIEEAWTGLTMQNLTLQFKSTVAAQSLYEEKHSLSLPSQFPLEDQPSYSSITQLSYGSFPVEIGKSLSFVAYANWKSTVSRDESGTTPVDTMENPVLSITLLEQD